MNIFLVDCDLGELPGHRVHKVHLDDGSIVSVQRLLDDPASEGGRFRPDVVIQMEHIGRRVFLSGLAELPCPKVFWAVDSHLNLFWQRWYGRLFDVVLTPHKSLFDALPQEWQLGDVRRAAMQGCDRPWRPHAGRTHAASFVGRIDQNRPQRFRFAQLLEQRHGVKPCVLPYHEMMPLYDDTRILPNESICREFNFRIMEGASCGCCVLTENIGDDLAANFEPGSEVLTYGHALELDELLFFLAGRPGVTEKIGKAAHRRVMESHLLEHRVADLLRMLPCIAAKTCSSGESERILALACIQWARANPAYEQYLPVLGARLECQPPHPDVMAMRLRLLAEGGQWDAARNMLSMILADMAAKTPCPDNRAGLPPSDGSADSLDLLTVCAVVALRLGELPLFLTCWNRQKHLCPELAEPQDIFQACLAWAQILARTQRLCQPGFHFDPARHCPETAFEMTQMAKHYVSSDESVHQWIQAMATCCDKTPFYHLALDYRARLSLDAPDDWRSSLEYSRGCLNAYFLEQGLAEATMARELARKAGEEEEFATLADPLLLRLIR